MAFPGGSEADLILALQRAATGEDHWGGVLARLAGLTGGRFAALIAKVPGVSVPIIRTAATPDGTAPPVALEDVDRILTDRMRPERVYAAAELVELASQETAGSALERLGTPAVRGIRLVVPDTASLALGVFASTDFDAADGAVLLRLAPYLQAAARTSARLRRERVRATVAALARGREWLLLDHVGRVLEASIDQREPLPGLLIVSGPLGDRLAFADQRVGQAFSTALDHITTASDPTPRAVPVGGAARHLRLVPWPAGCAGAPSAAAVATLHGEDRVAPAAAALLVDLFGLLPSEARLAAALGDGRGLADAALRLGLTIETARNYSKRIFAKTGTSGQADLLRLIFASGLAEPDRAAASRH